MKGATFALFVAAAPAVSHAQAYNGTNGEFRQTEIRDDTLLRRRRVEIGVNVAGVFTLNRARASDGTMQSQMTFYLNPGAYFGYMVTDRIQLRLLGSYLGIMTSNDGDAGQNSHSFLGGLQAFYHYPLPLGFAFYGGIGALGYYGGTRRTILMGTRISNRTYGGGGQVMFGLLIQPGRALTMRAGLRFDALFGAERPNDPSVGGPDQSTQNYQAMLEAAISFRL
jgi:hypothetical protein